MTTKSHEQQHHNSKSTTLIKGSPIKPLVFTSTHPKHNQFRAKPYHKFFAECLCMFLMTTVATDLGWLTRGRRDITEKRSQLETANKLSSTGTDILVRQHSSARTRSTASACIFSHSLFPGAE